MADQDRVGARGIQRAVGLVGEGEGAEGDAAVERQRHVAAELHGQAALRLRIVRRRPGGAGSGPVRSEEHTSELQSLMRISYAVFCLQKKNKEANLAIASQLDNYCNIVTPYK